MARLRRVVALARFLAGEYLKVPLAFVSDLIIPLIIFMIVQLTTGRGAESLIGILVAVAWASGAFALARKLATYRIYKLLDVFVASPVTQLEFAVAAALAHLVVLVAPSAVVMAILVALRGAPIPRVLLLLAWVLACWALGVLFGVIVFNRIADPVKIGSLSNLVNLALILLPPVMYPVDLLPGALQLISQAIPTVALKMVALSIYGLTAETPIVAVAALALYFAAFTLLAVKTSHWGEE